MPKGNGKPIPQVNPPTKMSTEEGEQLIKTLEARFAKNIDRHKGIKWDDVEAKLKKSEAKLKSLHMMESTGGEPDVVGKDGGDILFMDCSEQSPDRRSICYDGDAEQKRIDKGLKPGGNAQDLADQMGIELLDKEHYLMLQELGEFDTKTSSWIKTPEKMRELGGALFADRRFDTVFFYHNGAESFYGARGFRGMLRL